MKRLLVTGGSGYLGGFLTAAAAAKWQTAFTWLSHTVSIEGADGARLDIMDEDAVLRIFREFRPDAVVHTAYSQKDLTVIDRGTENIVRGCDLTGSRLVHLSTDAVFDGEHSWYRETDKPEPVHGYGKAKLRSEQIVASSGVYRQGKGVILRTSLVWGLSPIDPRTLFIREKLEKAEKLVLYDDEYRCPIRVDELAAAIVELLAVDFSGIIHIAGPERLNRYDFGLMLARSQGWNEKGITAGPSSLSGTVRPRDCSLDTTLARKMLRTQISAPRVLLGI
jgi:dTDP-4-dehydrorhamnose reductase